MRILVALAALAPALVAAQPRAAVNVDTALYAGLKYRMIGPFRGGRSTAVTGVAGQPHLYYMGSTGGGVWKTEDAGNRWTNISDGFFGGSIGAIDVANSDPNVIYVGTGSADIRGNSSQGRGVWKSTDAGRTWSFVGLPESGAIRRLAIHPTNPDVAWLAALGHPFGKNPERGVFRTRDGGKSWDKVLFLNDSTGASDIVLNPANPRILYAAMWRAERKPWTMISGSREGGIYKSTDGGDTWNKLGGGLP
ncbi:MAG: glycosyl hydrolase, partial [Gemmatimonadetes bacterium]|nr:glycosyl hydrolase [Gemmatimonadota bacterium]